MNNDKQSRLIHKFLEMIENDSELLLTSGLEPFLKNNNILDGINFINEVLNHCNNLNYKNQTTLLNIEFLKGEHELILENNKDFLIDWYLSYLSRDSKPLIEAIFSRELLRDKIRMRDMISPEFITEMLELSECPEDLKEIYKLKNIGFGKMADNETGEVVYKIKNGILVDKNYPDENPPNISSPYTDDDGYVWEWFGNICDQCKKEGINPEHTHEWHIVVVE